MVNAPLHLQAALGRTPQTQALLDGRVPSALLDLAFTPFPVISRAFAPMVRELRFDVSEMAIGTFLQAKACGKPLVLLPVVLAQRFQEAALLCRRDGPIAGPADLVGRRLGVRAYGQTTGLWLRGTLSDQFGIAAEQIDWVTFEGAHVAEIADPAWATRAPQGSDMLAMLKDGRLDAAIFGNDTPDDAALRAVFPDPEAAGRAFLDRHHLVPVNHMLCVKQELATPGIVAELMRMVAESAALSGVAPLPAGLDEVRPAVALALRFAQAQGLLPGTLEPAEVWHGLPDDMRKEMTA